MAVERRSLLRLEMLLKARASYGRMAQSSLVMSRAMSGKQIRFSDYELTVMSAHPVGPGLMKVGGCRHAADACCSASRGVAPPTLEGRVQP